MWRGWLYGGSLPFVKLLKHVGGFPLHLPLIATGDCVRKANPAVPPHFQNVLTEGCPCPALLRRSCFRKSRWTM